VAHEVIRWRCRTIVRKYADDQAFARDDPFEVLEIEGNALTYGGASALWERLIGTAITAFSNANAYLGVGNSSTAAAQTQTDLLGGSTLRKAMDSTYPTHTDGTTSGSEQITFRATFGSSDANFAWNEWGIFNASAAGRMLNRKAESLGTKASGSTWQLTVTLSLV